MRIPSLLLALLLAGACGGDAPDDGASDVPVQVGNVVLDPRSGTPVVLLAETDGERMLPIWIGFAEARSIASELKGDEPPRPNTHDLAKRLLLGLHGQLDRVVVTELREATFYAVLVIRSDGGRVEIDARPSDAIAIALRLERPIFVREPVFRDADRPMLDPEAGERIDYTPGIRNSTATPVPGPAI